MLKPGDRAPQFSLPSSDGSIVRLADYKGKTVVLYFYPKDDTPGCTKEACSFQEGLGKFGRKGAVVLGVSADSVQSHQKFAAKYSLAFPLLSDETKEVCKEYGVWQEKSLYGRKFMGIVRTTFIIDKKGIVQHIFPKVKVDGHSKEILDVI
jgi:thioredoxin-dependent peroxiredoxin